jgi:hypothetical protein
MSWSTFRFIVHTKDNPPGCCCGVIGKDTFVSSGMNHVSFFRGGHDLSDVPSFVEMAIIGERWSDAGVYSKAYIIVAAVVGTVFIVVCGVFVIAIGAFTMAGTTLLRRRAKLTDHSLFRAWFLQLLQHLSGEAGVVEHGADEGGDHGGRAVQLQTSDSEVVDASWTQLPGDRAWVRCIPDHGDGRGGAAGRYVGRVLPAEHSPSDSEFWDEGSVPEPPRIVEMGAGGFGHWSTRRQRLQRSPPSYGC